MTSQRSQGLHLAHPSGHYRSELEAAQRCGVLFGLSLKSWARVVPLLCFQAPGSQSLSSLTLQCPEFTSRLRSGRPLSYLATIPSTKHSDKGILP